MIRPAAGTNRELPLPTSTRWQPLRSGILNLYKFDDEEFWFESGRLLLRGNNGTGKSRVLALQLPFLFDGDVSPHRLEPDGDPAKRIEWNLLMGKHKDRLGYTWIEFGRRLDRDEVSQRSGGEPDGGDRAAEYVTFGCGLSAVQGRGRVDKWFFSTHRRIGESLSLQTPSAQPLTRSRLEEELGEDGAVYTSAKAYRAAVDAKLFRLAEARYEALVNLLIQLRQPQLARQLDENRLSAALSEALPPVSEPIIADVAEALRGLEAERTSLEAYMDASRAATAFLKMYSAYARIAARRRAADVRTRHSAYEATQRRLKAAREESETLRSGLAAARRGLEELKLTEAAGQERVRTLTESPEMRQAEELDRARLEAAERETAARRAETDQSAAEERGRAAGRDRDADARAAEETVTDYRACAHRAIELAGPIGLEKAHREAVAGLDDANPETIERLPVASGRLRELTDDRRRARDALGALVREADEAERALAWARREQEKLTRRLDEAIEAQRVAEAAREAGVEALAREFTEWAAAARELPLDEVLAERDAGVGEALREYARGERARQPVTEIVQSAFERATRRIADAQARSRGELEEVTARLDELRREEAECAAGVHRPPPPPHTRAADARLERDGAPLWKLCDFAEGLPDSGRAGIEAALEASGLLDAWVTPDGRVLDAELADSILVAGESALPPEGAHLGRVLVASIDPDDARASRVSVATVEAVLRHIGLGPNAGDIRVDVSGAWRLGPLSGFWRKQKAEHIGDAAREAARRARLEALRRMIESTGREAASLEESLAELDRRHGHAVADVDSAPGVEALDLAVVEVRARRHAVERERLELTAAGEDVIRRREERDEKATKRDDAARDLRLEAWTGNLDGLERAIGTYERELAELWPSLRAAARAIERARRSARVAAELEALTERGREELQEALEREQVSRARLETLERVLGASARAVLEELETARAEVESLHARRDEETARERELDIQSQLKAQTIENETETLQRDERERDGALERLRGFVRTRLLEISGVESEPDELERWSPTRGVELARRVEAALAEVESDDETWARVQRGLYGHVQELANLLLPHGHDPVLTTEEDLAIVEVPFHGRACTMEEFRRGVSDEIEQRQAVLDAREKEILENHLIGEVATHLHGRIRAAVELVDEMNRELHARPTSTGMRLRFRWQPRDDGPSGIAEARRRLLAAGGTWSVDDREALGEFLQRQIQGVRSRTEGGTWHENLTEALDYRAWHEFSVERQQDGQWRRLTRRTHGTGSGGEKAIALTMPMFAAAASHYRTADPRAPRLILLDEAFVGVDSDMRSKCMELLGAFDLDFVMTSEREWGCYPTVPAVAIYQLSSRPGIDAIGLTRWVWNGRERLRADPGARTNGGEASADGLPAGLGAGGDGVKDGAGEADGHTGDEASEV